MACGDTDRGRLLLGRYQVHQTVLHPDGEGADWRLALLHHPWDYLAEFDTHESRQSIHLHCDLVLRGHLHEGEAAFIRPPDPARACLELAAGCVYDGSRHPNAFQWIELWPDPKRVRVLFRLWNKGAWQIDFNQPGCPKGEATFLLYQSGKDGVFPAQAPKPAIPPDYLAWLRRTYGGVDLLGLPQAPLEPLPEPLQDLFVTRWFHTLDKSALAAGLIATIHDRDDLAPLAENPLLLTALCVIYGNGRRLPEDRYHLYQKIVDNVLYNRYPGDARQREPVKARLEAIAHGMHTGEGLDEDRPTPSAETGDLELERLLRCFAQLNPAYEQGRVEPAVQREELLTRSGLLLPRPNGRAAFYHLSFQEFLAAERISCTSADRAALELVFRNRWTVPEWRPTLLFLFAARVFGLRNAQWGLDLLTGLAAGLDRAQTKDNPAPAVFVAEALELCLAKEYAIPDDFADGFRRTCLDAIADAVEVKARQTLGLCLGRLVDPRIADLREPRAYVEVPAGVYVYGDQNEKFPIEAPFLLSRYPVTNSQYRAFMDDAGYTNRKWWSDAGWAWLQQTGVTEPDAWQERRWNAPNQPVIGVSFWEAQACCRWAGGRLPTEREWEAAARGPQGYEYPWGDPWEDGICNSHETGLGVTSPVGLFPRSAQAPLGLEDMAGNCWEWCDDFYYEDQRDSGSPRVVRGGAFDREARYLRSSDRIWVDPEDRNWVIGFRCVLAARRQP
ncbi:SUMF1/EgtB/PvdO family nonheme iron enzyme [Lamprocystis purpurea]|uniref:SUMF1/EgtB/PvdO family nonheme iron enzyme n=1 Tax=Lamprocystis purpurea TaxID=61598 RepID=UPI000380C6D4|nr:SUMF1/EgtB/PvdO family nonheme iron enzyme [Lamprocystis purpurea]